MKKKLDLEITNKIYFAVSAWMIFLQAYFF